MRAVKSQNQVHSNPWTLWQQIENADGSKLCLVVQNCYQN